MPYDNPVNRQVAQHLRKIIQAQINNTPMSYDVADGNVGYANKKLLDERNVKQEESRLEEKEKGLPELEGGSLGSIGGFAAGTVRDTGEGRTMGEGKKRKVHKKAPETESESESEPEPEGKVRKEKMKKTKELLLKRTLEGGKRKKTPSASHIGTLEKFLGEGKKKRGRPNKMCGGADLGETHNMIKKDGTTGSGKPTRQIGGRKLVPVANMQSSSMAGQGKETRADMVKRIMEERGVSMIKASSIIKDEKLYKPK